MSDTSKPSEPVKKDHGPDPEQPRLFVGQSSRRELFDAAARILIGAFGAKAFLDVATIDSLAAQDGLDREAVRKALQDKLGAQEAAAVKPALDGASALPAEGAAGCACECSCTCTCTCGCTCHCDGEPCQCLCDCGCSCNCGCNCLCSCTCSCVCDDETQRVTNATSTAGSEHTAKDSGTFGNATAGTFDETFGADWGQAGGKASVAGVNNNALVTPDAPTATASASTASAKGQVSSTSNQHQNDESSVESVFQPSYVREGRAAVWQQLRSA